MTIFDDLIRTSDSWAKTQLTHKKVTVVGYNDREESSFDDSTVVIEYFNATEGEQPDYNSDRKSKPEGVINEEFKVFVVPSDLVFNAGISEGVRDRILIEGSTIEYEMFSRDSDKFWTHGSKHIFLQPLTY